MEVKTDTKERFTVMRVETANLTANLSGELNGLLQELLKGTTKNLVLNLANVKTIDEEMGEFLVRAQQQYYEQEASFVICCLDPSVEEFLDDKELLELMNVTPSESEAWDIVQMEEVERELLGGEDE